MKTLICLLTMTFASICCAVDVKPLAPVLMESTFKIEGPTPDGKTSVGTCFIFLVAIPPATNASRIVLVTANHVLADIAGDTATVHLRKKLENGGWRPQPHSIAIRTNATPLWTSHQEADVSALFVELPTDIVNKQRWLARNVLARQQPVQQRAELRHVRRQRDHGI